MSTPSAPSLKPAVSSGDSPVLNMSSTAIAEPAAVGPHPAAASSYAPALDMSNVRAALETPDSVFQVRSYAPHDAYHAAAAEPHPAAAAAAEPHSAAAAEPHPAAAAEPHPAAAAPAAYYPAAHHPVNIAAAKMSDAEVWRLIEANEAKDNSSREDILRSRSNLDEFLREQGIGGNNVSGQRGVHGAPRVPRYDPYSDPYDPTQSTQLTELAEEVGAMRADLEDAIGSFQRLVMNAVEIVADTRKLMGELVLQLAEIRGFVIPPELAAAEAVAAEVAAAEAVAADAAAAEVAADVA